MLLTPSETCPRPNPHAHICAAAANIQSPPPPPPPPPLSHLSAPPIPPRTYTHDKARIRHTKQPLHANNPPTRA